MKSIRNKILQQRGVETEPGTRKPIPYADLPTSFHKSTLMKLVETRKVGRIEDLLWRYKTIDETAVYLDIDRSTVSKWRKLIGRGKSNV